MVNLDIIRKLAINAFIKSLSLLKIEVSELNRLLMGLGILEESLRASHEMMYSFVSKSVIPRRLFIKILISLTRYIVVTEERAKPDVISKVFNLYKLQVPVLSPLAYP